MINLHESMGPDRDRTRDPWICSETRICSQTRYRLRYAACAHGRSLTYITIAEAIVGYLMLHNLDGASTQVENIVNCNCNSTRLAFKESLEPSHGNIQLLKKNFYRVLILHLMKPLFSVFHVFQALSIFCFSYRFVHR